MNIVALVLLLSSTADSLVRAQEQTQSKLRAYSPRDESNGRGFEASNKLNSEEVTSNVERSESIATLPLGGQEVDEQDRDLKKKQQQKRKKRCFVQYSNYVGKMGVLKNADKVYHDFDDDNLVVVDLDDDQINQLMADSNVESIQEDNIWTAQGIYMGDYDPTENDGRRLTETEPYGIPMVQADQVQMGSSPVRVCIADTGISKTHPDLPRSSRGADRTQNSGTVLKWRQDVKGHGTHVSGTVAAIGGNDIGVVGVADGARLYITRALDDSGNAQESDVYEAVKQCAAAGANIISMSLGGSSISDAFKALMDDLYYNKDILIFAAAGNDGTYKATFPAAYKSVISVAAVRQDYTRWAGSNMDSTVEMAAPGDMILSTCVNSNGENVYCYYSGTSMATPHAAGVAALLKSHHPECSNNQIRYAMSASAKDLSDTVGASNQKSNGCDSKFGNGLIQAKSALDFLDSNPCSNGWGESTSRIGGCGFV